MVRERACEMGKKRLEQFPESEEIIEEFSGNGDLPDGHEEGEGDSDDIPGDVPVDTWVTARPLTRKYRKFLKGWPGGTREKSCVLCGKPCVIAASTDEEIKEGLARGENWAVVCDNCKPEVIPEGTPEGTTEKQAEEISRVARTIDAQERRN